MFSIKRITPRTCLWPLTAVLCSTFALSIGLTYRSNHHCYAGTCGEWLFPLQARLHVVVWYMWISLSVAFLAIRAFQPSLRPLLSTSMGARLPLMDKKLRLSGMLLALWICALYGILISIWWRRLSQYFYNRGQGLPGNGIVAAVALTGHLADVTTGMVLLPVSRHSALASFFKLSPTTTYTFHMTMAYVLIALIVSHGSLYACWASLYNQNRGLFRHIFPVLNPTYLYNEVWPGNTSSLGTWRASLIFTGSISSLIILVMFLTSFTSVRKRHFNLFYFTHLTGIVAVVVIFLHASTMFYCAIPGFSMWLLDWGMRFFELREKLDSRLQALGNDWYCLTLPLPRKRLSGCACHSPLAHFYLHHSESSIREIHPFTTITHLASQKPLIKEGQTHIEIQFLFRPSNSKATSLEKAEVPRKGSLQWTRRLASLVDEERPETGIDDTAVVDSKFQTVSRNFSPDTMIRRDAETSVRLEGPYFTPANPENFETVICLVAGTGLSGALAIASAFRARRSNPQADSETHASTRPNSRWSRCIVIWTVRERDFVHMPFFDDLKCPGLEFRFCKTGSGPRPNIAKELMDICGEDGKDSWCYISGPGGFITSAEQSCGRIDGLTWFAARWD